MPRKTRSEPADGLLTFNFNNSAPVPLDDLAESFHALAELYDDHLEASGAAKEAGVRLYIRELRTGSIVAVLQAIAEQGHLLLSEQGVVATAQSLFDHADTLAGFLGSLNDITQYFLGNPDVEKKPTKREAEQITKILDSVAKDTASQLNIQLSGPINIGELHFHISSQQANAVQNRARTFIGPSLSTNETLQDEVLTLVQMRGDPKAKAGDKGVIESVSKTAVKLAFSSEAIKKNIVEAPDNPFKRAFVVDVTVRTAEGKPALYKILALKDSFDKP